MTYITLTIFISEQLYALLRWSRAVGYDIAEQEWSQGIQTKKKNQQCAKKLNPRNFRPVRTFLVNSVEKLIGAHLKMN